MRRVLRESALEDEHELPAGDAESPKFLGFGGRRVDERFEQLALVLPLEGPLPRKHLVGAHGEREEVAAGGEFVAADLLRGHVRGRSEHLPVLSQLAALEAGDAEVRDTNAPVGGEDDVGGPDVAMNDPARMREVESRSGLLDHTNGLGRIEPAGAREGYVERRAVDVLEDEIRQAVHLADVEQGHDVRMRQAARDAGLVVEALEEPVALRTRRKVDAEGLDREDTSDERICRLVDGPGAARPQFFDNVVPPDLRGKSARPLRGRRNLRSGI